MERFDTLLTGPEAEAVNHHIAACTVPLIQESGDRAAVLGSGNFFEVRGRYFLISAAHIFEDFDPEQVGVPAITDDGRRAFLTLNGCRRYYWDDPDFVFDVTAVELPQGSLLASLQRTYQFLGPASVGRQGERFEQYVIVGYPVAAAVTSPGHIEPRAVKITTIPFAGLAPANFRSDREFLLSYAERGWTPEGGLQDSLPLPGVSGAAVWGVMGPRHVTGIWSATRAVRVVGVQHAYLSTSYIRCRQWWLVARLLEQIDPGIGSEFMAALTDAP